jgi:oligopeptide/dipeptide ABC transporter ATP-binding protein
VSETALLEVDGLTVEVPLAAGTATLVEDIAFSVARGRTVGLVGESGSGKSVTALAIQRLLGAGARTTGRVRLDDVDLLALPERAVRALRGSRIGMIFQDPMASLNPMYRVGAQIVEAIRLHEHVSRRDARARAAELLEQVGVPAPEQRLDAYPHELSGGLRQRVMIAIAIACNPALLVADEPTTALDVTIQAQVMDLLAALRAARGLSILLITHDLGLVAERCDDIVVMYAGQVVERGRAALVLVHPLHPYSAALVASTPRMSSSDQLVAIPGTVPDLRERPVGCRFAPRCPNEQARCTTEAPPLVQLGARAHRCHFPLPVPEEIAS